MRTVSVPRQYVSFDDEGNITDVDVLGHLNSLPKKEKLHFLIRALEQIQEEQYQGAKTFLRSTPGHDSQFNAVYEAMGRMYFVLHSLIDDYNTP
jgi:hypothetical protein